MFCSIFSQGLDLKIFHFASAINACAKSNAPDRDEVALRLFNDSRVSVKKLSTFLGFACLVGKIKFKPLFQGPLAKWEQIGIVFGISVGLEKNHPVGLCWVPARSLGLVLLFWMSHSQLRVKLLVWGPVVWIVLGYPYEKDCYFVILLEPNSNH